MKYRIGHSFLKGNSTLKKYTIIDVYSLSHFLTLEGESLRSHEMFINEEVYAILENGITQPETQDVEGRFTLEPLDKGGVCLSEKLSVGQRVSFKAELKEASLEIQGFIIRNFWSDYYLISEVGVSVPNRYWKVAKNRVRVS